MERKSEHISRRDALKVAGLGIGGLMIRPSEEMFFAQNPPENPTSSSTEWPQLTPDMLPKNARQIMELVPQTEIDSRGYLVLIDKDSSKTERVPFIPADPGNPIRELRTNDYYGNPIDRIVILQKAAGSEDAHINSHFAVTAEGIVQTRQPGPNGDHLIIWNLAQLDKNYYEEDGHPFVRAMNDISHKEDYKNENFKPALVEIYDGIPMGIERRSIVIKVDGDMEDKKVSANLISLLRALKIGPWEILDNLEVYGHNGNRKLDLGVETSTALRYYLGILALSENDEHLKKTVFGEFLNTDENYSETVQKYFGANREYLMKVLFPVKIQEWDKSTKYPEFCDKLFFQGSEIPMAANYFVKPIEKDFGGGYHHLQQEFDKKDPTKLTDSYHIGHDFNIGGGNEDLGKPFSVIGNGNVVFAGRVINSLGNVITVRHRLPDGSEVYSRYSHLNEIDVSVGQIVKVGEVIGTIGRSGKEDDDNFYAHLHVDLAYAATYEMFMKDNPCYYPSTDRKTITRFFIDLLKFIEDHPKKETVYTEHITSSEKLLERLRE